MRELAIVDRDSGAVRAGQGGEVVLMELGDRTRAGPPITQFAVDHRHLLERELGDVGPLLAEESLVEVPRKWYAILTDDSSHVVRGFLGRVQRVESNRASGGQTANTDVGHPWDLVDRHAQEHMRSRGDEIPGGLLPYPRRERRDLETQFAKHAHQQRILLETVTPPAVVHQFLFDGLVRERHSPAQRDVEILERDRAGLREHDAPQCFQGGIRRAGKADSIEVSRQVHWPAIRET